MSKGQITNINEQINSKGQIKKKSLLLSAAVFLLVLTGCQNPFDLPDQGIAGENGTFTLNIDGIYTGRTILPATVQSDFALYTLVFSSDGMDDISIDRTNATLGDPVLLTAAIWDLTVTAYFDSGKSIPAAQGSLEGITIIGGSNIGGSVELFAVIEAGASGTFRWNIDFPADVTSAYMTITPLDETGTILTYYFLNGIPVVGKDNSASPLPLNAGYYHVLLSLSNGKVDTGLEEYMHIYKNMESRFEYTFTYEHFTVNSVTSGADSGPGSLRYAIANAANNSTIYIEYNVETIALTGRLEANKNLNIEGNSVIITRSASWTTVDNNSQLLYISNGTEVNIRRVHFKDGMAASYGGAINNSGTLTLESCIFSGNQTSAYYAYGGVIYNTGILNVRGCTFYGNNSGYYGGAIYNDYYGVLNLAGNLFYENTAANYPVVYRYGGDVISNGYNVADVSTGTESNQTGWSAGTGDITFANLSISGIPFNISTFEPVSDLDIVIPYRPTNFPLTDFYGQTRTYSGAPGAVSVVAVNGPVNVTFFTNGATGTRPPAQTVSQGATITLPDGTGFYKYGYTFGGWNTSEDGTGTNYDAGNSYTFTGNIFLYAKWVIIPIVEDFTVTGLETFTYDGAAKTVYITANPEKSQGAITVLYNGTIAEPVNAGTYNVTFNVDETRDYGAVTGLTAGTLIINPKPVTITGLGAADKVYDGSANATATGTAVIDGNVDGENLAIVSGTAAFLDKDVEVGKTVIFSGYALVGTAADNYELSAQPANVTANITALRLTIGEPGGSPVKVYDGTTDYTGSGITIGNLTNVVDGDVVSVSIAGTTYNNANAASANQITIVYAISGADAANYTAPVNGTIAATITRAAGTTVSPPTLASKTNNRITINTVTAPGNGQSVEYAISTADDGTGLSSWQTGTVFTGLAANTTYYIYARSAENGNYEAGTANVGAAITTAQSGTTEAIYYWVNEQDVLAITDYEGEGTITISRGQELVITAQGTGYTNQQWHINGVNTGGTGISYTFSSMLSGKYTVGLFVQKNGKWYNANFAITVE